MMLRQDIKQEAGSAPFQIDAVKSASFSVLDNGQQKQTTVGEALKRGATIDIRLQAIHEAARLCQAAPKGEESAQVVGEIMEWLLGSIFYKSIKSNQWVAVSKKPEQLGAMFYEAYRAADGYPAAQEAFFKRMSECSTSAETINFWELLVGARKEFQRLGGPSNSWQTNLDLVARRQEQPLQPPLMDNLATPTKEEKTPKKDEVPASISSGTATDAKKAPSTQKEPASKNEQIPPSPDTKKDMEFQSKEGPIVPKKADVIPPAQMDISDGEENKSEQVSEIDASVLLSTMRGRPPEGKTDSYAARFDAALQLSNLSSRSFNPVQAGAWTNAILAAVISEKGGVFLIPIKRVEKDPALNELTTDATESEKRVQAFLKLAYRATANCPSERIALLKRLVGMAGRAQGSPDEYLIKSGMQQMAAAVLETFTYYVLVADGKSAVTPQGVRSVDAAAAKVWLKANEGLLPAILGCLSEGSTLEFYPTVRTSVENSLSALSGSSAYASDAAGALDHLDFYAGTEQQAEYKKRSTATLSGSLQANPTAEGSAKVAKSLVRIGLGNLDVLEQAKLYAVLAADLTLLSQSIITACGLDARLGPEGSLLKPPEKLFYFKPYLSSFEAAREEYNKTAGELPPVNLKLKDDDLDSLARDGAELRRGLYRLKREGEMISIYPIMPLDFSKPEAAKLLGTLFQYAHSRMLAGGQTKDEFMGGENAKLVMVDKKGRPYTGSELDYAVYLFSSIHSIMTESPDWAQPGSGGSTLADLCSYYLRRLAEDKKQR